MCILESILIFFRRVQKQNSKVKFSFHILCIVSHDLGEEDVYPILSDTIPTSLDDLKKVMSAKLEVGSKCTCLLKVRNRVSPTSCIMKTTRFRLTKWHEVLINKMRPFTHIKWYCNRLQHKRFWLKNTSNYFVIYHSENESENILFYLIQSW